MTLVGRDKELALIDRLLNDCAAGARRGLVLSGPTGIGKSTLLLHSAERGRALGLPTACVRTPSTTDLAAADHLTSILEQLGDVGRMTPSPGSSPPGAVGDLLHRLNASSHACLIVVDDLDFMSNTVAELLLDGLRRSVRPMAILLSLSRVEGNQSVPVSSGDLWYEFMPLSGLGQSDLSMIAENHVGGTILPSISATLTECSHGSPLLTIELLKSWIQSGDLRRVGGFWVWGGEGPPETIPESVSDAVGVRLNSLSEQHRLILLALVLLRRPASLREIQAVTHTEGAAHHLTHLCETGFISESNAHTIAYQVSQPAYAAAVLRRTTRTSERMMHQSIFYALESAADAQSSELAHHGSMALEPPPNLLEITRDAASDAVGAGRHDLAAHWYGAVLGNEGLKSAARLKALFAKARSEEQFDPLLAASTYSDIIGEVSPSHSVVLALLGRAAAHRKLGRYQASTDDLEAALLLVSDSDVEFEIRHALAVQAGIQRRFGQAHQELLSLNESAVTDDQKAKVRGHLAQIAYTAGDLHQAADLAEQALQLGNHPLHEAFCRSNLAWYLVILGTWHKARTLLEVGAEKAKSSGDQWTLVNLRADQARLYAWSGMIPLAIDTATEATRLAKVLGSPGDRVHTLDALGTALLETGDFNSTVDVFIEALALEVVELEPRDLTLMYCHYAAALLGINKIDDAELAAAQASRRLGDAPVFAVVVDRVLLEILYRKGQTTKALTLCERWLSSPSQFVFGQAHFLESAALVFDLIGKRDEAYRLTLDASNLYEELGAPLRLHRTQAWLVNHGPRKRGRPTSRLPHGLTKREIEVLWLTTQGKTAGEIGASLFLSEGTVRKHLEHIKLKAGVSRKAELVTFAARLKIHPDSMPSQLRPGIQENP